jgi:predicted DNA-binding transcriptional regulator AlpA
MSLKNARTIGTACIWPRGVEQRYDISSPTRWRWEKERRLPPRDVFVGGRPVGWRPETLDAADRGEYKTPASPDVRA